MKIGILTYIFGVLVIILGFALIMINHNLWYYIVCILGTVIIEITLFFEPTTKREEINNAQIPT